MSNPFQKHPDGTLRVKLDWTKWLRGASISTVTWTPENTSITVANDSVSGAIATAYISGGSENNEYLIDVKCVTTESPSRTKVVTIEIRVADHIL